MHIAVYLPLLISLLLAPVATAATRSLPDRLAPRLVVPLLTSAMGVLAMASTTGLVLLVAAAVAQVPRVAAADELSARTLVNEEPWAPPVGALAATLLIALLSHTVLVTTRITRRYRQVLADIPSRSDHPADTAEELTVLSDTVAYAVASPRLGRQGGQVIISTGMLAALSPAQQHALLAHEQAHIDRHHHSYLTTAAVAVALNPLLEPLRRELTYAVERCADESAASHVADRQLTAHAIGRAALAANGTREQPEHSTVAGLLGATTGPVPRRVATLLQSPDSPGRYRQIIASVLLLTAAAFAGAAAAHATLDLHGLLETAELPAAG